MASLEVKDLHVSVEGTEIVKGVSFSVNPGEVHAIMGPNGSGKSTMSYALMGHPKYKASGKVLLDGESILELPVDQRARKGLFLGFQYPQEVPGVSMTSFLRTTYLNVRKGNVKDFSRALKEKMQLLKIDESFAKRYLNEGFSGGEKKRAEVLQMAMLEPKIAILDETDSGLDIDALKVVAAGINSLATKERGILLITHYQRILHYVKPDFVHVMLDGRIVKSGGKELAAELEDKGYEGLINGEKS